MQNTFFVKTTLEFFHLPLVIRLKDSLYTGTLRVVRFDLTPLRRTILLIAFTLSVLDKFHCDYLLDGKAFAPNTIIHESSSF